MNISIKIFLNFSDFSQKRTNLIGNGWFTWLFDWFWPFLIDFDFLLKKSIKSWLESNLSQNSRPSRFIGQSLFLQIVQPLTIWSSRTDITAKIRLLSLWYLLSRFCMLRKRLRQVGRHPKIQIWISKVHEQTF